MSNRERTTDNRFINYILEMMMNENTNINTPPRNVSVLYNIINAYNRNIETYNNNISELIALLRTTRSRNSYQSYRNRERLFPRRTTGRPIYTEDIPENITADIQPDMPLYTPLSSENTMFNNSIYNFLNNTNTTNTNRNTDNANNSNTEDRNLTMLEINQSITTITYDESQEEIRCPISLEDFTIGEQICKINICGHIFKRDALFRWFTNHSRCPVCRCNVYNREHSVSTVDSDTISPRRRFSNNINDVVNSIAYNLLASLNTNTSAIQTFEFDIPLFYDNSGNIDTYDASGNIW